MATVMESTARWGAVSVRQSRSAVDGLGGFVWNGAFKLCAFLEKERERLVQGKRVLELGAGCGLPGIVAATLGASAVVLTDQFTDLLEPNVAVNAEHCTAPIEVATLGFGAGAAEVQQLEALLAPAPFDLVLGSEITSLGRETQGLLLQSLSLLRKRSAAGMRLLLVSDMCGKGCDGKCATGCPTARFLLQLSAAGWQVVVAEAFQYCDDPEIVRLARTDPLNFADGMEEEDWAAIWELELCAPPGDR